MPGGTILPHKQTFGTAAGIAFHRCERLPAPRHRIDGQIGQARLCANLAGSGGQVIAVQHETGHRAVDETALHFIRIRTVAKHHDIGVVELIQPVQPPAVGNGIHHVFQYWR